MNDQQPGPVELPGTTEPPRGEWRGIVVRLTVALLVLGGAYVGLAYYLGERVPAGTTVDGVDIGTLSQSGARSVLEEFVDAREPVVVQIEEEQTRLDPAESGLTADLDATLRGVAGVSFDPRTMWSHLTGNGRDLSLQTNVDRDQLERALDAASDDVNRAPIEAAVVLTQGQAKTTLPENGVSLDVEASAGQISESWPQETTFEGVTQEAPAALPAADVTAFVADFVDPALSAPVVIAVEDEDSEAIITPNQLSRLLTVEPVEDAQGKPGLHLVLDSAGVSDLVRGALVTIEQAPQNASVRLDNQRRPQITKAAIGKEIDEAAALAGVRQILQANDGAQSGEDGSDASASTAAANNEADGAVIVDAAERTSTADSETLSVENRTVLVSTTTVQPEIGDDDAAEWDIDQVMAEFTSEFPTGAENAARTENIRVGLRYVNGSVIMPGDQFSLADTLAPISEDRGYVEAGVIADGRLVEGIGGGLSQVSTTLLNAAWFSGVELNAFTPHSYYISRYPVGREATISVGSIDNVWTNDTSSPIIISTFIEGNEIVMQFYGDRQYQVETRTGERRDITEPEEQTDDSPDCLTQGAVEGFTITVARDLIQSGDVVRTDEYTTTYQASPAVTCTN